jgi:Flp pilus assembly protein TadG
MARRGVTSTRHGRRFTGDRGAAAVEFALVVPVLLLLVFGVAEFGRAYNIQTTLSGAAREGARTMALQNDAGAANAATVAAARALELSSGQISVSPGACPLSDITSADTVRVTVTYQMPFVTSLFGSGLRLTGNGVMQCNG